MFLKLIFLNLLIAFIDARVVQTQYGPIRGTMKISALNKVYFSFQRIPYMKPPIGKLRFRDPQPPDNWTVILDSTREGPRFPQIDFTFEPPFAPFRGDLDSMHINVYTNDLSPRTKYPVIVWIHGGGFRTGSGGTEIYGPDYFMERNVILVTFNYRLYTFGFLSLDDPELGVPGNAGMKDQVMALKWIKENIENFGGDSNNITIFGQSSGGGCAHYHNISPASQGLFQRSIIMSGAAFNPMYAAIPRRNWAYRLSVAIGYTGPEDERQILEFLEEAEPQAIFTAVGNLLTPQEANDERLLNAFGPVIEPYETENSFMLAHPEVLAKTYGNDIPIMIGATSFENGMLVPVLLQVPMAIMGFTNFTTFVPYPLQKSPEVREYYGSVLRHAYYGTMEPSPTNFDGSIILAGEFAFWHVIDRVISLRLTANASAPNYLYRFDANADNNCFRVRSGVHERWWPHNRAIHMDDLCYLFLPSFVNATQISSTSMSLIDHMISIFTNFASTGNPNVSIWEPATSVENSLLQAYNIREQRNLDHFGEIPEHARIRIWQSMYGSYEKK